MIIDFNVSIWEYSEKIFNNEKLIFTNKYRCPKCHSIGNYSVYGSYIRNIVYKDESGIKNEKTTILRVFCESCNTTHAILPNDVIPYGIYSFSFIMKLLSLHLVDNVSVLKIAKDFHISFELIYGYIKRFKLFLATIVLVIRTLLITSLTFESNVSEIISEIESLKKLNIKFLSEYCHQIKGIVFLVRGQNSFTRKIYIGTNNI